MAEPPLNPRCLTSEATFFYGSILAIFSPFEPGIWGNWRQKHPEKALWCQERLGVQDGQGQPLWRVVVMNAILPAQARLHFFLQQLNWLEGNFDLISDYCLSAAVAVSLLILGRGGMFCKNTSRHLACCLSERQASFSPSPHLVFLCFASKLVSAFPGRGLGGQGRVESFPEPPLWGHVHLGLCAISESRVTEATLELCEVFRHHTPAQS